MFPIDFLIDQNDEEEKPWTDWWSVDGWDWKKEQFWNLHKEGGVSAGSGQSKDYQKQDDDDDDDEDEENVFKEAVELN